MDKRVESLQADCLDGGSTPPSSTNRKERTPVLSFLFVEQMLQTTFTFPLNPPLGKGDLVKEHSSLIITSPKRSSFLVELGHRHIL